MIDHVQTGRWLQRATITWNLVEVVVTIGLGVVALVAFGLDSLIEVFASMVVLWHMAGPIEGMRDRRARLLVAAAFVLLAGYLVTASIRAIWIGAKPDSSPAGIVYLAATALVMFSLAASKRRVGRALKSESFLVVGRCASRRHPWRRRGARSERAVRVSG